MNKRYLIILLILVTNNSCVAFNDYKELLRPVIASFSKNEHFKASKTFYDNQPFSFISAQYGNNPSAILVLWKIENNSFYWVGKNNELLVTQNGKVTYTNAFESNFRVYGDGIGPDYTTVNKTQRGVIDLFQPDLSGVSFTSTYTNEIDEDFELFGENLKVVKIDELFKIDIINFSRKNTYLFLRDKPIYSEQSLHPYLSPLKINFYYK